MTNAETRRYEAIRATVAQYLDASQTLRIDATRDAIAGSIRALSSLGRTGRWTNAIGTWECIVRDEDNALEWALFQGSTWATHAA